MVVILGIIVIIVIAVVIALADERKVKRPSAAMSPTALYRKKALLTPYEQTFLHKLTPLMERGYIVVPQVNLASVIDRVDGAKYHNELFRNVDFGVFDSHYTPLLLIELNDRSHKQPARAERDRKVRSIAEAAAIPLLTFYADMPNEPGYVYERIMKSLAP